MQFAADLPPSLTPNATALLTAAAAEAARRGHAQVATEHLLHAFFAADGAGRGTAVVGCLTSGSPPPVVADHVIAMLRDQPGFAAQAYVEGQDPPAAFMSDGLKQSLALAVEVDAAQGGAHGVTTEYVVCMCVCVCVCVCVCLCVSVGCVCMCAAAEPTTC